MAVGRSVASRTPKPSSVGTPLCPYDIAYHRAYGSVSLSVGTPLCSYDIAYRRDGRVMVRSRSKVDGFVPRTQRVDLSIVRERAWWTPVLVAKLTDSYCGPSILTYA